MAKKVLIVATVVKTHIMQFHIPTIKMLKDMGWIVDVAARNDYKDSNECKIPYIDSYFDIPINRKPLSADNKEAYKELKRIIDSGSYDVVHCHTPMGGFLTRMAARDSRKHGTKVFYTVHGFHFFKGAPLKNWLVYYPAEKYCSRFTDVLITICDEDYELAKKKMKAVRIEEIPGIGIDIAEFGGKKEKSGNEGTKVLLSVGELIKRKNHEAVIRAMALIKDNSIRYLIAGDGELKGYLENLIRELRLEDKVKLLGYRSDVKALYKSSDLYIQPSFQEGLPVAVMEAMASGVPVVASNVRGNRDLLEKDMLFDPNDIQGIKDIISANIHKGNRDIIERNLDVIEKYKVENVLGILKGIYEDTTCTGVKYI